MKTRSTVCATVTLVIALCNNSSIFSQESRFTTAFDTARQTAEKDAQESRSMAPILKLFDEFKNPMETP